ncbi:MAG TPA: hypothetical protein VMZ31_10130 [Phycisphaerae bacterium]|nr:hypothetical protein [Phycisphaerae bacterium]
MILAEVDWQTMGLLLAALGPLTGVPLTMVAFYLRGLREQQQQRNQEAARRVEVVEDDLRAVRVSLGQFERDYTRKEEWLRESMHARQQLERLTEMMARIESQLENSNGLAGQIGRAVAAMVDLSRQLAAAAESRGQVDVEP